MPGAEDVPPGRVDDPPMQAYSRVTRDLASIYAPLAGIAEATVERLVAEYDVSAQDVLDAERVRFSRVIKAVALVPRHGRVEPLMIGWTDFPGLTVRLGDHGEVIPPCGCDACGESLEDCLAQFSAVIDQTTTAWTGVRR